MSYLTLSKLAADSNVVQRVTACAAKEGIPDPSFWAQQHMWELASTPGWVEAYLLALEEPSPPPGANEKAITDLMILSAVTDLQER